jgi:hypothetical protein
VHKFPYTDDLRRDEILDCWFRRGSSPKRVEQKSCKKFLSRIRQITISLWHSILFERSEGHRDLNSIKLSLSASSS